MIVDKFTLTLIALLGCLLIMKDLSDFVALGEKLGIKDDKLLPFAKSEYDAYLKSLEEERKSAFEEKKLEAERAEKAHERELRLLERRAQIAQDECAVAESAGSGGAFLTPCPIIQIYTL